jgi:menaquinone-dependent protoporphyrinogen oxidase
MDNKILLAYASRYGSTEEVAQTIASTLRESGLALDVEPMQSVHNLEAYTAIILGAPLYIGKWHQEAHRFLIRFRDALMLRPVAIFALGPISVDETEMQGSRAQLENDLANYPWLKPVALEMFIGRYDPTKLSASHRLLAMLPASPLHDIPVSDHRDWEAIRAWTNSLPASLGPQTP